MALLAVVSVTAGCTPDELAWYTALGREVPGLPCGQWVGTSRAAGFTDAELPTLHRIMWRESRCRSDARSPADDWGLLEVNAPTWLGRLCTAGIACTRADLLDPQRNERAARFVYLAGGWHPWVTYRGA